MDILYKNAYNKNLKRNQPKFKLWRSAGLMLTYKCSAACRFCYYNCSPAKNGIMPIETALKAWNGLKDLAGNSAKIHITGGEPFLYFDHLEDLLNRAKKQNLGQIDQLETNASWATDKKIITDRLKFLDDRNLNILKISCDPFHTEFIDIRKIKRLVTTASEILGKKRVLVRWQEYLENPVDLKKLTTQKRKQQYLEISKKYPFRFTSKAAAELGPILASKTVKQIANQNCMKTFRDAKGIHIDPFGNIFSGVCSGITVANVNRKDLKQIWLDIDWQKMDFFSDLYSSGPAAMLKNAQKIGYMKKNFYASKCHLCSDLREFFFDNRRYKSIIKPSHCYTINDRSKTRYE